MEPFRSFQSFSYPTLAVAITYLPIFTEKQQDRGVLTKYAGALRRELDELQQLLHCEAEGVGHDRLLFRFWSVDPQDPEREFNFTIDIGGDAYRGARWFLPNPNSKMTDEYDTATVLASNPVLPSMRALLDDLNETKDIYAFLVRVRVAFTDSVSPES
jgi:kinetochore protein Spc25